MSGPCQHVKLTPLPDSDPSRSRFGLVAPDCNLLGPLPIGKSERDIHGRLHGAELQHMKTRLVETDRLLARTDGRRIRMGRECLAGHVGLH